MTDFFKKKNFKDRCILIAAVLFSCAMLISCDKQQDAKQPTPSVDEPESLTAYFFNAGDADAALILSDDGHAIMIDTGLEKNSEALVENVKSLGVRKLDYLIISHPDKDHIGGADRVLREFDVETVLIQAEKKDSKQEKQFEEALKESEAECIIAEAGDSFDWAAAKLNVLAPINQNYEQMNDYSLAIMLESVHGKIFFAGDVENPAIADILGAGYDLSADILKVPHHGRKEKLTEEFFAQISPSFAVIPCDDESPADREVILALDRIEGCETFMLSAGKKVFRLDKGVSVLD